jgi:hypothetical protein
LSALVARQELAVPTPVETVARVTTPLLLVSHLRVAVSVVAVVVPPVLRSVATVAPVVVAVVAVPRLVEREQSHKVWAVAPHAMGIRVEPPLVPVVVVLALLEQMSVVVTTPPPVVLVWLLLLPAQVLRVPVAVAVVHNPAPVVPVVLVVVVLVAHKALLGLLEAQTLVAVAVAVVVSYLSASLPAEPVVPVWSFLAFRHRLGCCFPQA